MKTFNYIFGGIFILFALLQINDPDPYLWIPIYGYASLIAFLNAKDKYDGFANYALIVFCILYGAKLLLEKDGVVSWYNQHDAENLVQSMKATKPWIENTREFGGLLIILISVIPNIIFQQKSRSK
jgi:hypothetical protein